MKAPIIAAIVLFIWSLIFGVFGRRYLISYKLAKEGIVFDFMKLIPYLRLRYEEIDAVEKISSDEVFKRTTWGLRSLSAGTRIWAHDKVLIKRKGALIFPYVVMTPESPDEFVSAVKARSMLRTEKK